MAEDNNPPMVANLIISTVLVSAGLVVAFLIVILRFKNMAVLEEDILLGVTALLLVGTGAALTALRSGMQARLTSETARMIQENEKPLEEIEALKYKLRDAIDDRLSAISIPLTASVSSTSKTHTLNPTFKDSSGRVFKPETDILALKWKSDHPEFATVDKHGVVTYVAAGTAQITVTFRSTTSNACAVTSAA